MMFETDIEVLTDHTVDNIQSTVIKLTHGVIHQLGVYFPPGCANTVKAQIKRGLYQIFPTNPDGQMKGDAVNIQGKEFYALIKAPYQIEVYTWNVEATYDHMITVRIWFLKIWQLMPFSDEMFMLSLTEGS